MKFLQIVCFCIIALVGRSYPWPESEVGASYTSSVLLIKPNSLKTFINTDGVSWLTFEANVASTGGDYTDGSYTSFVAQYSQSTIVSAVFTANTVGSKFKINYTKDSSFLNRAVMSIKVFTFQE